jgi:hypothetical protein
MVYNVFSGLRRPQRKCVPERNALFLREMAAAQLTQVAIYKTATDVDLLKAWSHRHYLILDFRACPTSEALLHQVNHPTIHLQMKSIT